MSSSTMNKQNDIEEGLIASPPSAPNAAGSPPSLSTQGKPPPAVARWPGITPFSTAHTTADNEDAAGVRTGSAPNDAGTTTSYGPEHAIDDGGPPPSPGDIEAIPDIRPEKSDGPELVNNDEEGLPLPPGHIEAMLDGPLMASSSAMAMPRPLHDPEPSGGLKTTGLRAEDYLDERFNQEAGEGAFCPNYYIEDPHAANLKKPPELFPRAAGITDEDGTTEREARGLETPGLCAEDGLDERFNQEVGEGASCLDNYTEDLDVADLTEPPEFFPRVAGITDGDGTTERESKGLKTTGLYDTQDPDVQPSLFPKVADGEATDSSLKKLQSVIAAKTAPLPIVDGDDASAQLVLTEVEDDDAVGPHEDQGPSYAHASFDSEDGGAVEPREDQPGPPRRHLHDEAVSDDNDGGVSVAPPPRANHGDRQPNTEGPRQLLIRPPPPSMLPRPDDEESSDSSPDPPLLPSDPSMLMLEAMLVEETVYYGVPVPDEVPVPEEVVQVLDSCWRRRRKLIFVASIGLLVVVGLAVAVGVLLSSTSATSESTLDPSDAPTEQSELSAIELYIQSNVLQRNASWDDMANDDPRHLALNWILHQDKLQLESLDERLSQRYICALLAFSFDSLAWNFCGNHTLPGNAGEEHAASSCLATDQIGQEKNYSVWLSDTYECDWYGVTCENEMVIGLELNSNSLIGEIPPEISKLNIKLLSLKDNCIFGTIPQEMGSMKRLQELDLEHNSLSGTFPDELTDLINLVKLNLFEQYKESNPNPNPDSCTGSNGTVFNSMFARGDEAYGEHLGLSGNILGSQIGKLQSLEEIKIDYNNFSRFIAAEIGTLKKLVILSAGYNAFSGPIPQMTELTSLRELRLGSNKLYGRLPNGIGDMTSLEVLNIGGNYDIKGDILEEITQLTSLRELSLGGWEISGEVPKDIGNMRSLEILILSQMSLEGEIPNSLYNLSNLKELWLTDNRPGLHGTLSPNIGNLTKLTHLALDSNPLLTGTLPSELGRCKDLELLWLDNTGINGTAPAEVCDLRGLLYSPNGWGEVFRTDCSPNKVTLDPYFTCECCDTCCDHTTHLCLFV